MDKLFVSIEYNTASLQMNLGLEKLESLDKHIHIKVKWVDVYSVKVKPLLKAQYLLIYTYLYPACYCFCAITWQC